MPFLSPCDRCVTSNVFAVSIYDRRNHRVNILDLDNLAATLPAFDGEVHVESLAAVGYTVHVIWSNQYLNWQVFLNVGFVVVLGTPTDEGDAETRDAQVDDSQPEESRS